VFLDRNGQVFGYLLDYLRSNLQVFPRFSSDYEQELLEYELKFWGIPLPRKGAPEPEVEVEEGVERKDADALVEEDLVPP